MSIQRRLAQTQLRPICPTWIQARIEVLLALLVSQPHSYPQAGVMPTMSDERRNNLTVMINTALAEMRAEGPPVLSEAASSSIGDSADADALSALSDIPESEQLPMSAEGVSLVRPAATFNRVWVGRLICVGVSSSSVQPPSAFSQH
jgi:hypothetical protein